MSDPTPRHCKVMRNFTLIWLLVLSGLLIFPPTHAIAQQSSPVPNPPAQSTSADLQTKLDQALVANADLEKIISYLNANIDTLKSPNADAFQNAVVAHKIATMHQVEAIYNWQIFASNVSLALVAIIILAGVSFAGFQLWQAGKLGQPQAESQLELSASNFRITSSTVGIIVLALSFLFFYLFVKQIYVITPPT